MNSSNCNKSIECSVSNCSFHAATEDYCSLPKISVGTHETDPTVKECTDCMSFKKKC